MKKTVDIRDSFMAYEDAGEGKPVVFLHGNPTSSYLWRNVMPHVPGRTVAPDLIGMGDSGKPDIAYRFEDHVRYLDEWFERMDLGEVVIVGHDWGGALGMHYAARNPGKVEGVALVETFLRPFGVNDLPPQGAELFRRIRSAEGEEMILEHNQFVEFNLPRGVLSGLSEEDHNAYRRPFPDPKSRIPTLVWPREIPIDGDPADVEQVMLGYIDWAKNSPEVPKLIMTVQPGTPMGAAAAAWAGDTYANATVREVGPGGHNAPEDQPDAIGRAVAGWLSTIRS